MLLTADWHLTDAADDEYRWAIFDTIGDLMNAHGDERVFILGDLTDRKDRHSAQLVNRLVERLRMLGGEIVIIMGNHDEPLKGPPFWHFLNTLPNVKFHAKPHVMGNLLLLPFVAKPNIMWERLPFHLYKAAFMHQTVTGVVGDNGFELRNDDMAIFPRKLKVYSGDIHTPQVVRNVTYVGAPHPVKFGDTYDCRVLLLDDTTYEIKRAIPLDPMRKHMLTVSSLEELRNLPRINADDQARVRFHLPIERVEQWGVEKQEIERWATSKGLHLASIEALVHMRPRDPEDEAALERVQAGEEPEEVLAAFCAAEGVDGAISDAGIALLREELRGTDRP